MSDKSPPQKKARTLKATRLLQGKVGAGSIDEEKIGQSQKVIDDNAIDFAPMAEEYLAALEAAIAAAKKAPPEKFREAANAMAAPVMDLKGNAGMFGYPLVSVLAEIMLNFLEALEAIDAEALEIIEAHHKTLRVIVSNRMRGDGGAYGAELKQELADVCRRYFAKKASGGFNADDPFFVDG